MYFNLLILTCIVHCTTMLQHIACMRSASLNLVGGRFGWAGYWTHWHWLDIGWAGHWTYWCWLDIGHFEDSTSTRDTCCKRLKERKVDSFVTISTHFHHWKMCPSLGRPIQYGIVETWKKYISNFRSCKLFSGNFWLCKLFQQNYLHIQKYISNFWLCK